MLRFPPALWLLGLALGVSHATHAPELATGDLVFQVSRSSQSQAIRRAQGSEWSHVGLVEAGPEGVFVIEAEGRVVRTPWKVFRQRGEGERVLVLRPRDVPAAGRAAALAAAKRELGKPSDARFGWGDDAFSCSELVTKAYQRGAAVTLGRLQPLGSLRLDGPGPALERRFGGPPPLDLELVTPASLARDGALVELFRG